MSRLTKRDENSFLIIPNIELIKQTRVLNEYTEKLSQKEDDDEELGIDSHILFKALKNGIYVREHNAENEIVWEEVVLNIHCKTLDFKYPRKEIGKGRLLSMFGKTWALTKEELEK